jgi:hypothetical protein
MSGFGKGFNYGHFISPDFAAMIRLGRKRPGKKEGTEFPDGARWDFFVMDDVFSKFPEKEITGNNSHGAYKKDPKVIHGFISSADLQVALPVEWAKYGNAKRTSAGKMAGKRQCVSSGPDMATGMPGSARWLEKRDANGTIPTRDCFGYDCPDYQSGACKLRTYIPIMMPQLHPLRPFCIASTSGRVLRQFATFFTQIIEAYGEQARMIPLKFWREPTQITNSEGHTSTMGIVSVDLFPQEEYAKLFPDAWRMYSGMDKQLFAKLGEKQKIAIEAGLEKFTDDEHNLTEVDADNTKIMDNQVIDVGTSPYETQVREVMKSSEFDRLFKKLAKLHKQSGTPRQKETWIRKHGEKPDLLTFLIDKASSLVTEASPKAESATE